MNEILSYFTVNKMLDAAPPASDLLIWVYAGCFGLMLLLAIAWFFLKGDVRKLSSGFFTIFMTIGIVGLIYTFVRHEALPNLSARIVAAVIFFSLIVWLVIEAVILFKLLPHISKTKVVEEKFNKYLPQAKSKVKNHKS